VFHCKPLSHLRRRGLLPHRNRSVLISGRDVRICGVSDLHPGARCLTPKDVPWPFFSIDGTTRPGPTGPAEPFIWNNHAGRGCGSTQPTTLRQKDGHIDGRRRPRRGGDGTTGTRVIRIGTTAGAATRRSRPYDGDHEEEKKKISKSEQRSNAALCLHL